MNQVKHQVLTYVRSYINRDNIDHQSIDHPFFYRSFFFFFECNDRVRLPREGLSKPFGRWYRQCREINELINEEDISSF